MNHAHHEELALGERERARAAGLRALHKERLPEWEPFFRALYELGMVPGWRAIRRIQLKELKETS